MPKIPVRTFKNKWLLPVIRPQDAATDAVALMPGTYKAGQLLGQQTSNRTPANDVQTVTVAGTGGTFVLSFAGSLTAALPFNVTAAALQAALDALPNVGAGVVGGSGNVAVTGGPGGTAGLVVTFQAMAGNLPQPLLVVATNGVTGGGGPTVAHTTTGVMAGGGYGVYNNANADGTDVAACALKFDTFVDNWGRHYAGGTQLGTWNYNAVAYFKGYFRTVDLIGLDAAGVADLGKFYKGNLALAADPGTILFIR